MSKTIELLSLKGKILLAKTVNLRFVDNAGLMIILIETVETLKRLP